LADQIEAPPVEEGKKVQQDLREITVQHEAQMLQATQGQVRVLAGAGATTDLLLPALDNLITLSLQFNHLDHELYRDLLSQAFVSWGPSFDKICLSALSTQCTDRLQAPRKQGG